MQLPKFNIGDRVTYAAPELPYQKNRGIGKVMWETVSHYYIVWEDSNIECPHLKGCPFFKHELLTLAESLELSHSDDFPEILKPKHDLHGYFEHYQPVIKGAKPYWYRRYVYVDISGKLRHHHVPNKMVESIETLWRSGATAKEICLALGKSSK
jgi:hypothetical protein